MDANFENIAGHYAPKRAIEIAVAGGHSLLLVGPPGAGKDTLKAAMRQMDPFTPCETLLPCWCGYYGDVAHECRCSAKAIARYSRRAMKTAADFDIVAEVAPVPVKELRSGPSMRGTTKDAMTRAVAVKNRRQLNIPENRARYSIESLRKVLDDPGERIFEMACRRLSLGVGEIMRMMLVSRTIADLGGDFERIQARHVAEACQYRGVRFLYRN